MTAGTALLITHTPNGKSVQNDPPVGIYRPRTLGRSKSDCKGGGRGEKRAEHFLFIKRSCDPSLRAVPNKTAVTVPLYRLISGALRAVTGTRSSHPL